MTQDGHIDPVKLLAATTKEVEAGLRSVDDPLHQLALAGATLLTPLPDAPPRKLLPMRRLVVAAIAFIVVIGVAFTVGDSNIFGTMAGWAGILTAVLMIFGPPPRKMKK